MLHPVYETKWFFTEIFTFTKVTEGFGTQYLIQMTE